MSAGKRCYFNKSRSDTLQKTHRFSSGSLAGLLDSSFRIPTFWIWRPADFWRCKWHIRFHCQTYRPYVIIRGSYVMKMVVVQLIVSCQESHHPPQLCFSSSIWYSFRLHLKKHKIQNLLRYLQRFFRWLWEIFFFTHAK